MLSRAIRGDQSQDSGDELAARKIKADVVDVGVTPTVHDYLVPGAVREAAHVGMCHKRPVGLPAEEKPIARRDDEKAPVGQPVDAEWKGRHADDDVALALEIDGNDLLRAPVAEPETVIVPPWRLAERETGHQGLQFWH